MIANVELLESLFAAYIPMMPEYVKALIACLFVTWLILKTAQWHDKRDGW